MNLSALDVRAELLVVSQFTLYADLSRGRRPYFGAAASPELARPLVEAFVASLSAYGLRVATGEFGAMMDLHLVNDGPVTLWLDSAEQT
jgi:D-tyrosyl-tRNA(Tyr) deacylase